jgi:ribosomal protein S7
VPIQCLANAKLMNGMKIITTAFEKIEKKTGQELGFFTLENGRL